MVSTGSLLRLSASAAVMNGIVPSAVMVQLALLGRRATALQASFGLVVTATSFGSVVFNFLVDGVTAKVGNSVGARRYREATGQVRMAFLAALVCGGVAAATLLALRDPLFSLFKATPEVAMHARPYFFVRSAAAPAQCLANAASGCLGGYGHVHAATALSVCRALAEAAAVALAATLAKTDSACFAWIGFAYAACASANAAAGLALVVALPPKGSNARLPVLASFSRGQTLSNASDARPSRGAAETEARDSPRDAAAAEDADASELERASGLSFFADGASMFVRSVLLNGTFFGAMVVASRELGPAGLAAHNVVCQLWMLSSYVVDGFATAGTVTGSRLVGEAASTRSIVGGSFSTVLSELRWVCHRLLAFGLLAGAAFLALAFSFQAPLAALFTADEAVASFLRAPGTWRTLALAQPLNALVFVYDGLVYPFQDFAYARELMSTGVGYVFLPSLAFVAARRETSLGDIWRCKVALNAWRLALLAARTHWSLTTGGFAWQVRESELRGKEGASLARRAARARAARAGGDAGGGDGPDDDDVDDDVAWTAAPAREEVDATGDDVEAPLLSRRSGSP